MTKIVIDNVWSFLQLLQSCITELEKQNFAASRRGRYTTEALEKLRVTINMLLDVIYSEVSGVLGGAGGSDNEIRDDLTITKMGGPVYFTKIEIVKHPLTGKIEFRTLSMDDDEAFKVLKNPPHK
ncbi:hypothetical protein CMO83_01560 [Candidatus Woesearchaeota archaeon]|jgi:hypothetical protein|nr:hypothetical protein [Candidatus Woesearchaeota archaeon]MDP6648000.1 hypothetical protein [Candidatus Woesearchaeota archaeon]|tara:strand:- start:38491 stop:38865 length:375 start_codon:yes stop_codon:yes gene_type:complete